MVTLGVIQKREEINERIVQIVLFHVSEGLTSRNLDYRAAAYMILSQLCLQVTIESNVIVTLIGRLTKVKRHVSDLISTARNQKLIGNVFVTKNILL